MMRSICRIRREAVYVCVLAGAAGACIGAARLQPGDPPGLPPGPTWGGGSFRPTASNVLFATGDGCSLCHSASKNAGALWSATGEDVSPYGLWRGTMMANSARDPYWHATVAKETAGLPEDEAARIESLCVRCHTPMGHHTHLIAGAEPLRAAEAAAHPLYADGVSCTVCHQVQPDGLGTEATWDGRPVIRPGRTIFGPFADPAGQPMKMHAAFTPTLGEHIRDSALCASCHTLRTGHTGTLFHEQTPYLEWRNSAFSNESPGHDPATAQTCQECHMPEVGAMRLARNPGGVDFNIPTREGVRGHSFVGGNAFMLDLMRANREELGIAAPDEALDRMARATRAQLSHRTATIGVSHLRREAAQGGGQTLAFDVTVANLTGHKFPTGYPARRAWIHVQVRSGQNVIWESGGFDAATGRLKHVEDELAIPHYDAVTDPSQVVVYEMVAADADGKATAHLSRMASRIKDTRLLPAGWSPDGPHAAETSPVGAGGDATFVAGADTAAYRVALPPDTAGGLVIVAWVRYQTVPPAWVAPVRGIEDERAQRFVRMYDAAGGPATETIAVTVAAEGR